SKVLKTTNAATTGWTETIFPSAPNSSLFFSSADSGFIVGNSDDFYRTTNSGLNWIYQDLNLQSYHSTKLNDVFFVNNMTGFIASDYGLLLKSMNGGNDWKNLTLKPNLYGMAKSEGVLFS